MKKIVYIVVKHAKPVAYVIAKILYVNVYAVFALANAANVANVVIVVILTRLTKSRGKINTAISNIN